MHINESQAIFNILIPQMNKSFDKIKKSGTIILRLGLGTKKPRLPIPGTIFQFLGTKLFSYALIFHPHKEEDFINKTLFAR